MKIIIFYPEVYEIARFKTKRKEYPPFGVLYLAAVLENEGYLVKLGKISVDNTVCDLTDYDIVMYSLSSTCTYNMMLSSKKASKFKNSAKIILGGIHATVYPHESFKEFAADFLVRGEGEIAIVEILNQLNKRNVNIKIKGVLNKFNNTDLEFTDYVKDLDTIPFPARHLLPEEDFIFSDRFSRTKLRMTHLLVSRGCPYNCYFCGGQNKQHRYRSSQNIIEEIKYLISKYNIQAFVINDENFIIKKSKVIEISNALSDFNLPWSALSRMDIIDDGICKTLKQSGCVELKFGLESGSDTMLKNMNKKCTLKEAQNALDLCFKYKIKAKIFLIHGFPGENETTTNETIKFLSKNKNKINRISLFRWTPLPGSYVHKNAHKYGLNQDKLQYNNYIIYHTESNWFLDEAINETINTQYIKLKKFVDETF